MDTHQPRPAYEEFGMALGGGAVRGLAHIGVVSALGEAALRPSWISGTSAGALVGAFWAFGLDSVAMEEALNQLGWRSMSKLAVRSPIGTLTNEGLEAFCVSALGDVSIEDSPVPLGVVATDINSGERLHLTSGRLATAVRASCCLPSIYAPVEFNGRLLVDGALVENIPARAVRELGAEVVVAVGLGFDLPFREVSNHFQVMVNAFEIAVNTQMHQEAGEADVYIAPKLEGVSKVRAHSRETLLAAGHEAATHAIPQINQLLGRSA